jgi:hypothetical protein
LVLEQNENGISISISNNNATPEPAAVPVMASAPMTEGDGQTASTPDFPWYQITVVGILFGILVCVFRKK